jgi:hypothetical protein
MFPVTTARAAYRLPVAVASTQGSTHPDLLNEASAAVPGNKSQSQVSRGAIGIVVVALAVDYLNPAGTWNSYSRACIYWPCAELMYLEFCRLDACDARCMHMNP